MKFFENLPLMKKIGLTLGSLFIIIITIGIMSFNGMKHIRESGDLIFTNYFTSYINLSEADAALAKLYIAQKAHIIAPDDDFMQKQEDVIASSQKTIQDRLGKFEETLDPGEETEAFKVYDKVITDIIELNKKIISLSANNNDDIADQISNSEFAALYQKAQKIGSTMLRTNVVGAEELMVENEGVFSSSLTQLIIAVLIAISAIVIFGMAINSSVVKAISNINTAMTEISGGQLEYEIPYTSRHDEVGSMAGTLQIFKENAIQKQQMEAEQKKEQKSREERIQQVEKRTSQFENAAVKSLSAVKEALDSTKVTAQNMTQNAEEADTKSSEVSNASELMSNNVQTVAAATEELNASINEINQQVLNASNIAGQAVEEADKSNEDIQGLAETAQKIGAVVSIISDIAEQTNLLALNATIEAARAGEAGKGFAVVASEVKNLANQTAKATEEISSQVNAIQSATQGAVDSIVSIGGTIKNIDEIATGIAAAVEEQLASTTEISRSIDETTSQTQTVANNIVDVARAAGETGKASIDVLNAANGVADQTEILRTEIENYISDMQST